MAIPSNTSTRPGPPACATSRPASLTDASDHPGEVCPYTVYTRDADDVAVFAVDGPSLDFSLRFNSMYAVVI